MDSIAEAPETTGHMAQVDIGSIEVAGLNPRETNTESEAFAELCSSIQARGILQPLLLRQAVNGEYQVVAGHRRLAAAKHLSMETVPALVIDLDDQAARIAALTENVQRENMTPVEEAKALKELRDTMGLRQVDAAQVLGKSERWARERERILELPEPVVAALGTGILSLESTIHLQRVNDVSPAAAAAMVEIPEQEEGEEEADVPALSFTNTGQVIDRLRQIGGDVGLVEIQGSWVRIKKKTFTKVEWERISYAHEQGNLFGRIEYVQFREEDEDAARSFGALLELEESDWRSAKWVTDTEWLADRVVQIFEKEAKKLAEQREEREKGGAGSSDPAGSTESAEERKAAEEERETKEREREAANAHLFQNLEAMKAPSISLDLAKLLVAVVIGEEPDYTIGDLFGEYDERFRFREATDDQPERNAADIVLRQLNEAKSVEEVLAIGVRVLAFQATQITAHRSNWVYMTNEERFEGQLLVEKYVMGLGVLPDPNRKAIEERWAERERRAAEEKAAAETEEAADGE